MMLPGGILEKLGSCMSWLTLVYELCQDFALCNLNVVSARNLTFSSCWRAHQIVWVLANIPISLSLQMASCVGPPQIHLVSWRVVKIYPSFYSSFTGVKIDEIPLLSPSPLKQLWHRRGHLQFVTTHCICCKSSSVFWCGITGLTTPGRIWQWRWRVQTGSRVFSEAKSLTLMPSLLSSAADSCRFLTWLRGFLDGIITAFAWWRGFKAAIPIDVDTVDFA